VTSRPGEHARRADEGSPGLVGYAEDGCGRSLPLWLQGVAVPVVAVAAFPVAVVTSVWGLYFLSMAGVVWGFIGAISLRANWPTGIRLDSYGIRIGGVREAEHGTRRRGRPLRVDAQRYAVFSCPWPAVRGLALITDRAKLRQLRSQARSYTGRPGLRLLVMYVPLGWLSAPYMRAALVVHVTPGAVAFPEFRDSGGAGGAPSRTGVPSPTWLVPTRHPDKLRAALARLQGTAPPVDDHITADAPVQFGPRRFIPWPLRRPGTRA
jgi:hypothetical protein